MAIGTAAAILGSAAIGAVGSAIGGKSQSKAATQAANISSEDNAQNRQFLEGIYNRNVGFLSPYMQSGVTANNAVMELLGLTGGAGSPQPSAFGGYAPMASTPYPSAFGSGQPIMYNGQVFDGGEPIPTFGAQTAYPQGFSGGAASGYGMAPVDSPQAMMGNLPAAGTVTTPAPTARSAFDNYRNSTGYDFRFNEGTRGLQSAFSRNLDSGAATKASIRYGQGIASDEFGRYIDLLRGQAQLGFGAGSALAGVGQQFGNTVTAGNTAAANAQANARLYAGNANANMWAGLGSSFGQALGAFKW